MRKHLFVSVRTVVRLAALSVIALANSNMETSAAEHIQAVVSSCVVETEAAESNFTWSRMKIVGLPWNWYRRNTGMKARERFTLKGRALRHGTGIICSSCFNMANTCFIRIRGSDM